VSGDKRANKPTFEEQSLSFLMIRMEMFFETYVVLLFNGLPRMVGWEFDCLQSTCRLYITCNNILCAETAWWLCFYERESTHACNTL